MEAGDDAAGAVVEEDGVIANGGDNSESQRHRPIISGEQLDVEGYAALYTGRTKITRLLFIADKCGVPSMEMEALRMAFDEIKKGENTQLFREVVEKISGRLGPNYGPDNDWADHIDRQAELTMEKLENELYAYKADLIKESIRMCYEDFGDFYYAHGQLDEAFKNYIETHDYCTTSKQIILMCQNAILVSIEMGRFIRVPSYVSKAEQSLDAWDPVTIAKLCCAAGLAHLEGKEYKLAALKFLEVGLELGNSYTEVIASQDVATYGSLCALASFDRAELKSEVINNANFRNFLDLLPEIRELINDFYTSHYASCLEYLGNLKANLFLDIHLHDHVETLYDQIRSKALIQYTLPFVSADLRMMANAFNTCITGLEKELEALITNDQIQARIDSHNKILYARHADQRNVTFQRVLQTGYELEREIRAMLLRENLMKHEHNSETA